MRSKALVDAYRNKIHAYARSETWAKRSRRYRALVRYKCAGCGKVSKANHCHHLDYAHAFTGREPDSDLMCLCPDCHHKAHEYARRHRGITLREATLRSLGVKRGFWRWLTR